MFKLQGWAGRSLTLLRAAAGQETSDCELISRRRLLMMALLLLVILLVLVLVLLRVPPPPTRTSTPSPLMGAAC